MDYVGARLDGRYQIEELIGEGGMANVYRAKDLAMNREVAVKILKEEYKDNIELVRRFMNESRAISVLNHPNIVKVFDVSVSPKLHYIVMELISGITLKEYIEQRGEPLTYKEVVHFISQVLRALQHAHDKGIVHRDIKPQNIMILEDGSIKVMDFGIARLARSEIYTKRDQAIGSVHYISPEQAQGAETDLRADIYSLGIMMYEMLSGTLPFEDDDAVAIAVKQISDEAQPLLEVNPSAPPGLCDITMKAMAKEPAMRYQSALEMLRDIEEFKQNPSIKFEYEYLAENSPARYVNKVMNEQNRQREAQPPAKARNGATAPKSKPKKVKKRRRIGFLVPIMLGVTIVMVAVCGLYTYNLLQNSDNPFFGSYEEIELPDFTGQSYDEVMNQLKRSPYNHLRVAEIETEYNPDRPVGEIMAQLPVSNNDNPKVVKGNQILYFTVNQGVQSVEIPNVSGMSRKEASRALLSLGITPYVRAVRMDGVAPGIAYGTEPEAGTMVQNAPGNVVTILISSAAAEKERTVPNLIGVEGGIDEVQRILSLVGLQIGQYKEVHDASVTPGTVIEQNPQPGTVLSVGGDVHITFAIAPPVVEEPVPDPDPVYVPPVVTPPVSSSEPASSAPPASSEPPVASSEPPVASSEPPVASSVPPASSE